MTEVDPSLRCYQPKPQKPQRIVDVLITLLETDEPAEAARQRLAKPSDPKKSDGSGPATSQDGPAVPSEDVPAVAPGAAPGAAPGEASAVASDSGPDRPDSDL